MAGNPFDLHVPKSVELQALTRDLFARARLGGLLNLRRQDLEGAEIHRCYENARLWIRTHPGDMFLPGYVYFDYNRQLEFVRFTPHVAVFTVAGELLDLTPHNALDDHPFIQHIGTDEEFTTAFNWGHLDLVFR